MRRQPLTIISGARVIREDAGADPKATLHTVIVEGDRIRDITPEPPGGLLLSREDVAVYPADGAILTPGLIDVHINGAFGVDFNQTGITPIQGVLQQLPARGVTGIALTAITAPLMDMLTVVNTLEEVIHHARPGHCRPLGIHLEGPFLNPAFRGTHPAEAMPRAEDPEALSILKALVSPNVRVVTLAPEQDPDGLLIGYLAGRGVRVSAGHSGANTTTMSHAMDLGVNGITHWGNAMGAFHQREPGIMGLALCDDRLYVEVIGDGVHLHPETIRLATQAKPSKRLILVSDAMALAGQPEGNTCRFAGQQVTLQDGRAVNAEGNLAGSAQLLDDCLRNVLNWGLLPWTALVHIASTTPAEYLGQGDRLGRIAPGYLADLVLWDKATLRPRATWIGGELVYQAEGPINQAPKALQA